jgi:hypothetical protein
MQIRVPAMIRQAIPLNHFPADVDASLERLAHEIESGPVRLIEENAPDRAFWQAAWGEWAGCPWLEVPWYLSESYAYRRILEATHYFQPGPTQSIDPYRAVKLTELEPKAAPRLLQATLRDLPSDPEQRFETWLYSSLWGNRIDLSYIAAAQVGRAARLEDERVNLLVDDAQRVWDWLAARRNLAIAFLLDNSGTELLMDLALADFLLQAGIAARIDLHLKPQPFFISDAMPQDVEASLAALEKNGDESRALAERLRACLTEGRLTLRTHWFNTSCLFYFQMPDDLNADLAATDFVFVKGDCNYRRLVGEYHWLPTVSFQQVTAYFPAPLVALRTLKCEVIVGLREGESERLNRQDPQWLTNGTRGVVQATLKDE